MSCENAPTIWDQDRLKGALKPDDPQGLHSEESEKGRPLPKFGEWDVNDPTSAEGFTVIFNKARDEKKTGGNPDSPGKIATDPHSKPAVEPGKT
ncbi:Protein NOI4 [Glycine soja]|uniref:Protein NOI4 n=1 Tax=Glycine soja TaxID=3848 RepID=A0A445G8I4_GLYSO|nr:Protein NOI4 [Glycine soja]